jgi:ADP-heptose:LPS heptosyltransferase
MTSYERGRPHGRPRSHVLVARLDSDGDVLLSGPAIRAVAASGARVTLMCGPRGTDAARLLPCVDAVLTWRAPWIDPEPEPMTRALVDALVDDLAARQIDAAVILTSFHQSALPLAMALRMAGVGFVGAISEDYPGSLLDVRHQVEPDDLPEAERGLSVARACGFDLPADDDGRLRVDLDPIDAPDGLPRRYVVVHPGASVPARAWEPERCRDLVALLTAAGHDVVVTGAPGERALTAFVAGDRGVDLGGRTSLAGLAHVLRRAAVVVVGNTGPAHLAAAVGTPVVSVFAPTVPAARWAPYGVPREVLFVPVPCAGCRARDCPVPGHPCLAGVMPADVHAAVDRLLSTRGVSPPGNRAHAG